MSRLALVFALLSGVWVFAQAPLNQSEPAFEVASVKPNTSGDGRFSIAWPPGSLTVVNMPLRAIIGQAFQVPPQLQRFTLIGGPDDLLSARFDIQAKTPDNAPQGQHFAMLRTLLADRFKLRVHKESRPLPVYALTPTRAGNLGPELRPSKVDCNVERQRLVAAGERAMPENAPRDSKGRPVCWGSSQLSTPGATTLTAAGPLGDLLRSLQGFVDRPAVDATGLTGTFEWHLAFSLKPDSSELPSIYTAVQEQLGLKLEATRSLIEVLVIDHVEMPTPN